MFAPVSRANASPPVRHPTISRMLSQSPRVESFIIRFVQDLPDDSIAPGLQAWRGVVIHVQTNEEKHFTHLADALAFMAKYVPVGDLNFKEE